MSLYPFVMAWNTTKIMYTRAVWMEDGREMEEIISESDNLEEESMVGGKLPPRSRSTNKLTAHSERASWT
ncbi:hypothetical protein MATL_G00155330 [Megalops atlanticus]|uniref:Uncharacterized protein n=1 Tax=Megalops atlanticus TaxID=7932 RepID=A0A9D3PSW5_MEGAT|nr:hypothetical protein MATL_G00155330 [Megalops atlanticus]